MVRKLKKIPKFRTVADEASFWANHDSTEYLDFSSVELGFFPELKPSSKTISIASVSCRSHQTPGEQAGHSVSIDVEGLTGRKGSGSFEPSDEKRQCRLNWRADPFDKGRPPCADC